MNRARPEGKFFIDFNFNSLYDKELSDNPVTQKEVKIDGSKEVCDRR